MIVIVATAVFGCERVGPVRVVGPVGRDHGPAGPACTAGRRRQQSMLQSGSPVASFLSLSLFLSPSLSLPL